MNTFLVEEESVKINSECVKKIFNRMIYLLYIDKNKIKLEQNLKLYDNIILNIVYIFYFLMNDIEIYNMFLKNILPDLIDIDFDILIQKLVEEIQYLKEIYKPNHKQFLKLEELSNDLLKINDLYLFK